MTHYNFLKLKEQADVEAVLAICKKVYAQLEQELDFLSNARVCGCATQRDSNADIMMVMEIDPPVRLRDYLQHPKHVSLSQNLRELVAARMSFDEE